MTEANRDINCVGAGRQSGDCEEFRADPSQQPGGHGADSAVLQGGRGRRDAGFDWVREIHYRDATAEGHQTGHGHQGENGQQQGVYVRAAIRYAGGADVLFARGNSAIRVAPAAEQVIGFLQGLQVGLH